MFYTIRWSTYYKCFVHVKTFFKLSKLRFSLRCNVLLYISGFQPGGRDPVGVVCHFSRGCESF